MPDGLNNLGFVDISSPNWQSFKSMVVVGFLWDGRISGALTEHTLVMLLFNMKTGHTEKHEVNLRSPILKKGEHIAIISRSLYHRIKAHFGTGPFTTSFTMSHGPFIIHGYIKADQDLLIPVKFEKAKKGVSRNKLSHNGKG